MIISDAKCNKSLKFEFTILNQVIFIIMENVLHISLGAEVRLEISTNLCTPWTDMIYQAFDWKKAYKFASLFSHEKPCFAENSAFIL